jgi:hypothetical protein
MTWNLLDAAGQTVPFEISHVADLTAQGTLTPDTLVWHPDLTDWVQARQVWEHLTGAPLSQPPALPPTMSGPPPLPSSPVAPRPGPGRQSPGASRPPSRGKPPAKKRGFGFYAMLLVFGPLAVIAFNFVRAVKNYKPQPKSPAEEGLAVAEEVIQSKTGTSSGPTPAEKEAAQLMAEMSSLYRDTAISQASGTTRGIFRKAAKGMDAKSFVAYCKVKDDAVLFLLHVPDLRKFEEAAKESMLEGAWTSAQFAIASMPEPRPKRLTVAIRGIVSYYGACSGKTIDLSVLDDLGDRDPTNAQLGIDKTTTEAADLKKAFLAFFEVPAPSPVPAPPAKSSAP